MLSDAVYKWGLRGPEELVEKKKLYGPARGRKAVVLRQGWDGN
jgi:hypothetical protein